MRVRCLLFLLFFPLVGFSNLTLLCFFFFCLLSSATQKGAAVLVSPLCFQTPLLFFLLGQSSARSLTTGELSSPLQWPHFSSFDAGRPRDAAWDAVAVLAARAHPQVTVPGPFTRRDPWSPTVKPERPASAQQMITSHILILLIGQTGPAPWGSFFAGQSGPRVFSRPPWTHPGQSGCSPAFLHPPTRAPIDSVTFSTCSLPSSICRLLSSSLWFSLKELSTIGMDESQLEACSARTDFRKFFNLHQVHAAGLVGLFGTSFMLTRLVRFSLTFSFSVILCEQW